MTYREVLRPPWWTYAAGAGMAAFFCFTFAAVIGVPAATVLFVVLAAGIAWVIHRRSLQVTVDDSALQIGGVSVPRERILDAVPLDAQGLRDLAGRDADGRAVLVLRNLATKTGVKVEMDSQEHPYMLLSSADPAALAAALRA